MKTMSQILMLAAFSLMALAACGKKKGGDDPAPAPVCTINQVAPPGQYCNNGTLVAATPCTGTVAQPGYACVNGYLIPMNLNMGAAGNLLNNVQFVGSFFQGAVNISGSGFVDPNNPNAGSYSGPVTINGTMVLASQFCGAPGGMYVINGNGYMNFGSVENTILNISGPASMQLNVIRAIVHNPTTSTLDRNSMTNQIMFDLAAPLTVNGVPCGSITTY